MNKNNRNRLFELFIVLLLIVTLSTPASASKIELGKYIAEPGEFILDDVINFTIYIKNPNSMASGIINILNISDTLPDGNTQQIATGLVLQPQESRKYYIEYIVRPIDVDNGLVINRLHMEGKDSINDLISASTSTRAIIINPSIDIEKTTNGKDADTTTGPVIPVGTQITWSYVVTNDGNVHLDNVGVTDDQGLTVTCSKSSLEVGESMTCTAIGTAEVGQYSNLGAAIGEHKGIQVSDNDPSHYFGEAIPSIDIEKATNGEDADTPNGPELSVGDIVTWAYVVTNDGNVPLENVVVTDNKSIAVKCPQTILEVGESKTCTATGTAEVGQYSNIGLVTAEYNGIQVTDEDPSNYFGFCTGIIGDYVWLDKNGDCIQDIEEHGIGNVIVELYLNGVLLSTDTTNSNGGYLFTDICEGLYVVDVVESSLPDGIGLTTPPEPREVDLGVGEENRTIDFGYKCIGTIGDFIWEDIDGDGIQDLGEVGIENVEVSLYLDNGNSIIDAGDTLLDIMTTDVNGNYLFEDLCSGRYIVEITDFTIPAGYVLTTPPELRAIDLATGEEKLDVDLGYQPPCPCYGAIGDHIWMDLDNDKIPDADESGIQGVLVKLYQDANGNEVIDSEDNLYVIKVTGANGNFIFTGLCEGKYIIEIDETSLPPGVVLTTPPEPKVVDLVAGQHLLGNDFGYSVVLITSK